MSANRRTKQTSQRFPNGIPRPLGRGGSHFEKWKKVFPNWKWKDFDTPHLIWHLSEMVPGIVLNDARLQKVFKWNQPSYWEYQRTRIRGKPLLSYLQKYYDERKDFADFLKKSWKFVKKNEEKIKKI
jgi:hypothetical protein